MVPSIISYSVSPSLITFGDSVRVSGVVDIEVLGKTLIFAIEKPDGLVLYRTVTTGSDDFFDDSFRPDLAGNWTVTLLGSENSNFAGRSGMEKSFGVIKLDPVSMLPPWLLPTLGIIIPISSIIAIAVSYTHLTLPTILLV